MKYVLYVLYKYYGDSKHYKDIAYFSAVGLVVLGFYMNFFTLLVFFFNTDPFIFNDNFGDSSYNPRLKLIRYVEVISILVVPYVIFYIYIPESKIKSIRMSSNKRKICLFFYLLYYILSVLLLVFAIRNN